MGESGLEERVAELEASVERLEQENERGRGSFESATGSNEQRALIKGIKRIIELGAMCNENGADLQDIYTVTKILGIEHAEARDEIEKLRRQGEIYEPQTDHLRVT